MHQAAGRAKQKFLFLLIVSIAYLVLITWHDFLQRPFLWDESHFWDASLTFSDNLIPELEELRNYGELNTPLPFIIFGGLEYLFSQGIFAGRLFNLILSIVAVFIIGWPGQSRGMQALLCAIGVLSCPYYLWYSGLLYTDALAYFWVLVGLVCYVYERHGLSCVAFILAIASRQYAIAFPAAIVLREFSIAVVRAKKQGQVRLADQWRWLIPTLAALSIVGWILLFGGLAPEASLESATVAVPEVQETVWAITPGGATNFLAFVGLYLVIPEFILFRYWRRGSLQESRRAMLIAAGLLVWFIVFPPLPSALGILDKITDPLPSALGAALAYGLALAACLRFFRSNLLFLFLLFNSLIMMKAYPWDKYILPFAVAFWYLKSLNLEDRFAVGERMPANHRLGLSATSTPDL